MMNILLGITGSVAATLIDKLTKEFIGRGHDIRIVVTDRAFQFLPSETYQFYYADSDEFYRPGEYQKDGLVTHIDLRDWADVFIIAPCSANTMAKLANGICDNLLTSIARAWDYKKPFYIAPAMNTLMWTNPMTKIHIDFLSKTFGIKTIWPTSNKLACGQCGIGAMAHVHTIANIVEGHKWYMPISFYGHNTFLPEYPHPGAFGTTRAKYNHTGVDIYSDLCHSINAVEDGIVVAIEPFTGTAVNMPWWNDTYHITIKGKSGLVVYGELNPHDWIKVGSEHKAGYCVGYVEKVIKNSPEIQPDNWRPNMLHIELLHPDAPCVTALDWPLNTSKQSYLLDPTPYLKLSQN
jgi:phosphopantothenoylcysteine decarboxylase